MKRTIGVLVLAISATLLSGCSPSSEVPSSTASPGATDVGRLDISTHAPQPTDTPTTEPSVSDSPLPSDDHDDTGVPDDQYEGIMTALCSETATWWSSATKVSLKDWVNGGQQYAPADWLVQYTDVNYKSLKDENWDQFTTIVLPFPEYDAGACAFERPSPLTEGRVEVVVFTYQRLTTDSPLPAKMLYNVNQYRSAVEEMARESLTW